MIKIERRHTALRGRHVAIILDEEAFDGLAAAVQVAYDDPDSVPAGYRETGAALWDAFYAAQDRVPTADEAPADADRPPGTSGSWGEA